MVILLSYQKIYVDYQPAEAATFRLTYNTPLVDEKNHTMKVKVRSLILH